MSQKQTTALRICIDCQIVIGIQAWPWNGQIFTHTHGLCAPCFERLTASLATEEGVLPPPA